MWGGLDAGSLVEFTHAKLQYRELLGHSVIYWKQRSKQFWLAKGDANTHFHSMALVRRKRNNIYRLKDDTVVW